jgi:3-isopropylmalate/(R)-2-methylmalate dehydratase small subunit
MEVRELPRIWMYDDDVNTDVIFPGKYTYSLRHPDEIAAHALEDLDPEFTRSAQAGDFIIAGRNWGMGSSREQAVTCLVHRGVAAVIARSFARIYYRNAINQGLLVIACPDAVDAVRPGSQLSLNLEASDIIVDGREYHFPAFSPTALQILASGGLIPFIQNKLQSHAEGEKGTPDG